MFIGLILFLLITNYTSRYEIFCIYKFTSPKQSTAADMFNNQ